jgi:tetratricopeptide (TPR) repeat protein
MPCPRSLLTLLVAARLVATEPQPLDPDSAAHLTALGNAALHNRQFESAIALYDKALVVDRNYFYAHYNLGLASQEQAAASQNAERRAALLAQAAQYYQNALTQRPEHAEVLCNLGFLAHGQGEYRLAAQRFQAAQEKADSSARAAEYAYNRGTSLQALGEWTAARDAYRDAIALNPDHFAARYNLGSLLADHLDDPAGARRELRQAHEIDPRRPEPLVNLALLTAGQDAVEAERLLDRAAAAAADHEPALLDQVRWRRALFYWHAVLPGKTARVLARDDLLRLLESSPDFPGAHGLLGQYYDSIGAYAQAIPHLEKEVAEGRFDPGSAIDLHAHYLLALIYSEQVRDGAAALRHATRYYELRPDGDGEALRLRAQRAIDAERRPAPQAPP